MRVHFSIRAAEEDLELAAFDDEVEVLPRVGDSLVLLPGSIHAAQQSLGEEGIAGRFIVTTVSHWKTTNSAFAFVVHIKLLMEPSRKLLEPYVEVDQYADMLEDESERIELRRSFQWAFNNIPGLSRNIESSEINPSPGEV